MSKLKEKIKPIRERTSQIRKKICELLAAHPVLLITVLSYAITFANEAMSRHSIWDAVVFLFTRPLMFLCNMAIVAAFEALALMTKKRRFWLCFFSILWLGLGITNFILLFGRITPFAAKDFVLFKSVFSIIPTYLGWFGTILSILAIIGGIIALIVAYFKTQKRSVAYMRSSLTFLVTVLIAAICLGGGFLFDFFPDHFPSLHIAYEKYGFNFCFSVGVFDSGINKPKDYDKDIDKLVSDLLNSGTSDSKPTAPTDTPNIIFVQLESFYDLASLKGFEFSEDPTPFFSQLRQSCMSGILTVPSIGAGTANTEFEVLSGMSMSLFGMGEYPYESILQKQVCESICYILDEYGYTSHAVHNYKGYFYSRNIAFANLGFDTFTSIEYMNGLTFNPVGWANDRVLLSYVTDCLDSTDGADFIQCITVQGHGKYPTSDYEGMQNDPIDVLECPEGANEYSYKYLANQMYQTDRFIGELISSVQARDEETVIVFYGDHIPNIGIQEKWLPDGMTLYDTEYVIWRSNGHTSADKNFTSYQLSGEVLELLGIDGGMMPTLHRKRVGMDEMLYKHDVHMLQYDLLYGDRVAYGGALPFEAKDIRMGINDITVTDVYTFGDNIYVKGTGFTQYSKIFVNGSQRDTEFIDDQTLILQGAAPKDQDKIRVIQVSDLLFQISSTDTYIYSEKQTEDNNI